MPVSDSTLESPVIALDQVTCQFASASGIFTALQPISVQVAAGEKVALVGPSGSGKSTLLMLLNGTLSPSTGTVRILGKALNSLSGAQRRQQQQKVGTVYQQHQLIDNLSVIHNINAGYLGRWPLWRALWSLIWPQEVEAAQQVLTRLGMGDKLHARTSRLSGGQQQRVAIARVLVQNPEIILADEPVASVDPARSHDIMQLFCDLAQQRTLLISLHDTDLAKTYCDRIIGLRQGSSLFDLPAAEVSEAQLTALYDLETTF